MLKTMRRIVQEVDNAQSLDEALAVVARRVREAVETQACTVLLLEPETHNLIVRATDGLNPDAIGAARLLPRQGLAGLVVTRGEPINLDNAPTHSAYHLLPEASEEKFKAFLGAPIIFRRRTLGVIVAQQEEARRFDEAEEAFLATVATQLASRIARGEDAEMGLERRATEQANFFEGLGSVSGVGIGKAVVVYPRADLEAVPDRKIDDIGAEVARFNEALTTARDDLKRLSERLAQNLPPEEQALFDVYLKILDRDSLGKEVNEQIETGSWAESALKTVIKRHLVQFEAMDDPYLRERASDFRDLGDRILAHLQRSELAIKTYPPKTILVGYEVPPAALAEVPRENLAGVISVTGSSNSHIAILARAMGVPTVMGASNLPVSKLEKLTLIADGYNGRIYVSPKLALLKEYAALAVEERELDAGLEVLRDLPAITKDDHSVKLCVNTGLAVDVEHSLNVGADGIGLYRTEVPFMIRESFPSEETQRVIYRQLLGVFAPRPVTMRTLDVGGDKVLPYFPIEEANPFLGWRGIRLTLDHPDILRVQLRAMLRASRGYNNLQIMFPMVSVLAELEEALRLLHQAYQEVLDEGDVITFPKVGVMIEVPSAVYQAQALARRVDFLSVGSNDLTQYILAVDRNNARVAYLYDALQPAVLKALQQVAVGAKQMGKSVSICGEMAGEPAIACLLLAMGYDTLSMNSGNLLRIKYVIRNTKLAKSKQLLATVLTMDDPILIRRYLETALVDAGLGGLVRAGKY